MDWANAWPHDSDDLHISFWMLDSFAPEKTVVKVEPL